MDRNAPVPRVVRGKGGPGEPHVVTAAGTTAHGPRVRDDPSYVEFVVYPAMPTPDETIERARARASRRDEGSGAQR